MQTTTIRPGLLVSLKTSVAGNVSYKRLDLENAHLTDTGEQKARWETERTVTDPAEFEAATKLRSKCRTVISSVCSQSAFGLLCPDDRKEALREAVAEAQALAADFNSRASLTSVAVYVVAGTVAQDDVQAVRAINSEIRDLLTEMEDGLKRLDVEAVRNAANKARGLGQMLSQDAAARVQEAVETARSLARKIVKSGEAAAVEIDEAALRNLKTARTAFLDLDDAVEVQAPEAEGRVVEMEHEEHETDEAPEPKAPAVAALPEIEL